MIDTINETNFKDFLLKGNLCIVSWNPKEIAEGAITCNREGIQLKPTMSYEEVVSKLIRVRYTTDEEFALINNALEGIANLADNAEYKEYQEWRSKCKETAKTYLKKDEEGQAE